MRIGVWPVLVVLVLAGLFAALNWTSFTTPTTLDLGFTTVSAPIGLVMIGAVALLGVLYIVSVVTLQGETLLETRRINRELQSQRELAEKAEASRFTELRDFMSNELLRVTQAADQARAATLARIEQLEQRQRVAMEETANSLSAYIGQLEDRLDHRGLPPEQRPLPPEARGDHRPLR
jgi:uncharacterized integral membrane protein